MKLQIEPHSLKDVINFVIKTLSKKIDNRPIYIKLPAQLPDIPFDNALMQEVFINLIDNAIKFTPPDSPIEISVIKETIALLLVSKIEGLELCLMK